MAKKVAYVVFVGRKTGIFTSWDEVKAQVNGFPGQKQQGYTSMADAEAAWAAWTSRNDWRVQCRKSEFCCRKDWRVQCRKSKFRCRKD